MKKKEEETKINFILKLHCKIKKKRRRIYFHHIIYKHQLINYNLELFLAVYYYRLNVNNSYELL